MTWWMLLRNELRSGVRTFRALALPIVTLFFALTNPLATKLTPELLRMLPGDVVIVLPEPQPVDAMLGFVGDLGQMLALIVVITMMGIVARDRERGVTGWLLTMPVGRVPYLTAKLAAMAVTVVASVIMGTLVAWAYSVSLLGPVPLGATLVAVAGVTAVLLMVGTVTVVVSALSNNQLAAGGAGFLVLILTWLSGGLLGRTAVGPYLPARAMGLARQILTGDACVTELAIPVAVTLLLSAAIIGVGVARFTRSEL